MKWGVRRALNKDVKSLRKQYKKTDRVTSNYDNNAAALDELGSKLSRLTKKEVKQTHDRAVDESRRMRKMEKDFVDKWGESIISEINEQSIKSGKNYTNYVLSMPENRKKYSEGAKGRLSYDEPESYRTAINRRRESKY